MQMIFQDPYASLDPRWRVGDIVAEPLIEQGLILRARAPARAAALLASVGLDGVDVRTFPLQFLGGQRQRISIARSREQPGVPRLRRADVGARRVGAGCWWTCSANAR